MPVFRDYKLGAELHHTATSIIYAARKPDQPERSFVAKVYKPFLPGMPEPQIIGQFELFVNAAEVQRKVAAAGSKNWASIYAIETFSESVGYVTDCFPQSLQNLIDGRIQVTHRLLCALIGSIARGLADLEQTCGRSHGNLKPANILLVSGKHNNDITFVLSDPLPDTKLGRNAGVLDLRAVGQLIHQLVTHRPVSDLHHGQVPFSPEWKGLGRHAKMWIQLCSSLLAAPFKPDAITLEGLLQDTKHLQKSKQPLWLAAAVLIVIGLLIPIIKTKKPDPTRWDEIRLENLTWVMQLYQNRSEIPELFIGQNKFSDIVSKAAYPYIHSSQKWYTAEDIPNWKYYEENTSKIYKKNEITYKNVNEAYESIKILRAFLGAPTDLDDTHELWEDLKNLDDIAKNIPAAEESVKILIESVRPPIQIIKDNDIKTHQKIDIAENMKNILGRRQAVDQIDHIFTSINNLKEALTGVDILAIQELAEIAGTIHEEIPDPSRLDTLQTTLAEIDNIKGNIKVSALSTFSENINRIKYADYSDPDGMPFAQHAERLSEELERLKMRIKQFPPPDPGLKDVNSISDYQKVLAKLSNEFHTDLKRFGDDVGRIAGMLVQEADIRNFINSIPSFESEILQEFWQSKETHFLGELEKKPEGELYLLDQQIKNTTAAVNKLNDKRKSLLAEYEPLKEWVAETSYETVLNGILNEATAFIDDPLDGFDPNKLEPFISAKTKIDQLEIELSDLSKRISSLNAFLLPDTEEVSLPDITVRTSKGIYALEFEPLFQENINRLIKRYESLAIIAKAQEEEDLRGFWDREPVDPVVYAAWLKAGTLGGWLTMPEHVERDKQIADDIKKAFEELSNRDNLISALEQSQRQRLENVLEKDQSETLPKLNQNESIDNLYKLTLFIIGDAWASSEVKKGTIDKTKFLDSKPSSLSITDWLEKVKGFERIHARDKIKYPEGFPQRLDSFSDWIADIDETTTKKECQESFDTLNGRYRKPEDLIVSNEVPGTQRTIDALDDVLKRTEEASKPTYFVNLDRDANKTIGFKDSNYNPVIEPVLVENDQIIDLPKTWSELKKHQTFLYDKEKNAWPSFVRSIKDSSVIFKYVPGDGGAIKPFYISLNEITYGQYAHFLIEIKASTINEGHHDGKYPRKYYIGPGDSKRSWPENNPLGKNNELKSMDFTDIPVVWVTFWGSRNYASWIGNADGPVSLPTVLQHEFVGKHNYLLYCSSDFHFRNEDNWKQACIWWHRQNEDGKHFRFYKFRPEPIGLRKYNLYQDDSTPLTDVVAQNLFSPGVLFARKVKQFNSEIQDIQGNVWEWCIADNGTVAACGYSSLIPPNDKGEYTSIVSDDPDNTGYCDVGFRLVINLPVP